MIHFGDRAGLPQAGPADRRAAGRVRDWARNRVLWALLAVVPAIFILLATAVTPSKLIRMPVTGAGRSIGKIVNLASIHPDTMAPIAIASLAALAGRFIMLGSRAGDQRLVLSGQRPGALLAARFALVAAAAAVATVMSLAVTATVSDVRQWGSYIAANALIAVTCALIGVLIGPAVRAGRRGVHRLPDPLPRPGARAEPDAAPRARRLGALPARLRRKPGPHRRHHDPAFTQARPLLIALAWLAGLLATAALLFRHTMRAVGPAGPRG